MEPSIQAVSAKLSTIVHATEDQEKVSRAIRNLGPSDIQIVFTMKRVKGHHGNEITTVLSTVKNSKSAEKFLQSVWNGMSQLDKTEVYSSLHQRIDQAGTLFLRVDKQEALKGKIRLLDKDPIKIAFSFRTMPKSRAFVDRIRKKLEEI